ncbi:hypothetical protein P7C71_g3763, partial [Lecanoromycetidae sp. Uapishka_2]
MSTADLYHYLPNLSLLDKTQRTESLLWEAIDNIEPPRLRLILQDLCKGPPKPREVTAALLLITAKKYAQDIEDGTIEDEGNGVDTKTKDADHGSSDEEKSCCEVADEDDEEEEDSALSDNKGNGSSKGSAANKNLQGKGPVTSRNNKDKDEDEDEDGSDIEHDITTKDDHELDDSESDDSEEENEE